MTDCAVQNSADPLEASSSRDELAATIASFNALIDRLHTTHESLRAEVTRLEAELKEANRRLRRSQELAALGEMAAGIAHEVRNPLGSIRLYASLLFRDLDDRPEQQEIAAKIDRAVGGLDRIVGDVLDFSRTLAIGAGRVLLGDVVHRSIDACRGLAESSDRAVEIRAEAIEQVISGDAALLERAVVNVLRNAIEAASETEAERWVAVSASEQLMRRTDGSRRSVVVLRVEDSGRGVSDEAIERMFNPFFTTRAVGTGLGLAIVHRIVDAHDGEITVRNGAHGAIVEVALPAESETVQPTDSGVEGLDITEQGRNA